MKFRLLVMAVNSVAVFLSVALAFKYPARWPLALAIGAVNTICYVCLWYVTRKQLFRKIVQIEQKEQRKPLKVERPVSIGVDCRCDCSCADVCPIGKTGSSPRCTRDELHSHGILTIMSFPKRGDDATIV